MIYKKNKLNNVFNQGKKIPILFSSISLTLGIFLLVICYFSFTLIDNSTFLNPTKNNFYVASKKNTLLNTFSKNISNISDKEISEIKRIEGVLDVGKVHTSSFRCRVMVFGNINFKSEIFLEGINNRFLDIDTTKFIWDSGSSSIPLVISREFLKLYNFSFAKSTGLPMLTVKTAKLIPLSFEIGTNTGTQFFPSKIIGFTDRYLSLFVPSSFLEWANKNFTDENMIENTSSKIIIKLNEDNPSPFFNYIDKNNYMLHNDNSVLSERVKLIEKFILFFLLLGLIMICISLFCIFLSNQIIFEKEILNITELRLVGYSITTIKNKLFLNSVIGVLISYIVAIASSLTFMIYVKTYTDEIIDYELVTTQNIILSFFLLIFIFLILYYLNRKVKIHTIS